MLAPSIDEASLREIVHRLVVAVDPDRIVLFGSRARGEAAEELEVLGVGDGASSARKGSDVIGLRTILTAASESTLPSTAWKSILFDARMRLLTSESVLPIAFCVIDCRLVMPELSYRKLL